MVCKIYFKLANNIDTTEVPQKETNTEVTLENYHFKLEQAL
jgi:hypothetical protein